MQRYARFMGVFLCSIIFLCPTTISATDEPIIDTSNTSEGYFSVYYSDVDSPKMKIGVTYKRKTTYFNYNANETFIYALEQGNGTYTVTLYRNVRLALYRKIASETFTVKLKDRLCPYLVSTNEITFSDDDVVGKTAYEICKDLDDTLSKVIALHEYIFNNIAYDFDFAADVESGKIKTYIPNTANILSQKKGICYDYASLFAAMCRSQGIPCRIEKGDYKGKYHAWNRVFIDTRWYTVDPSASLKRSIFKK